MRRSSRRGWAVTLWGLLALVCVLVAGFWAYAYWANTLPPFRPRLPPMPSPNGYERAVALVTQLPSQQQIPRWPRGTTAELRSAVGPARSTLDQVRETFGMEWRARPWLGDPNHSFMELASFRECARYFAAESRVAESEGDPSKAMRRNLDAMDLGAKVAHGGTFIHALVAAALQAIGSAGADRLARSLPAHAVPPALERVRRIRHDWPPFAEALEVERVGTLASMSHASRRFRQNPVADFKAIWSQIQVPGETDWSIADEVLALWLYPKRRAFAHIDQYYRQQIIEAKKPFRQRKPVPVPVDPVSNLNVSMSEQTEASAWWRTGVALALLEAALATRIYQIEHSRYPAQLSDVSRRWLPSVPVDPWGQPIVLRLRDGRPLLYSLGPDGRDDRGSAISDTFLQSTTTGDIVFGSVFRRRSGG